MSVLNSIGLRGDIQGDGIISHQSIEANKEVKKGTMVNLKAEPIGD